MVKGNTIRMWRRSLLVMMALLFLGFGIIVFRLAKLQLVDAQELQQMALGQQLKETKISAKRGTIYDCNMKPLAQSATVWTVVLEPNYLKKEETREVIAQGLSQILEVDKNEILEKAKKRSYYVVVARKIEGDTKDKIIHFLKEKKIKKGVQLIEDNKRYYPYSDFMSSVIGYVGTDNQGLAGLEAYYDKYLAGEVGKIVTAKNAVGTDMPFEYEKRMPAKDGNSLVLCIDEVIQQFLESAVDAGKREHNVLNSGVAIAMNVNTGEILGLAVRGGFDPNKPFEVVDENDKSLIAQASSKEEKSKLLNEVIQKQVRNTAVNDAYMPGSTFKLLVSAAAIEENLINENTPFHCSGSIVAFPGAKPTRCHKSAGHGAQKFWQAFCNSCNPAFVKIGQLLGVEGFYKYFSGFGLTQKTGIDLPGEASGIFFSKDGKMGPMDLTVASFGQNFRITPIQMITAWAAACNGGYLVRPHIVKQILDAQGNIVVSNDTFVKRQVVSKETSKRVTELLAENVRSGAGKTTYLKGYRMGAKTGTSQKVGDSREGRMDHISSCCTVAPTDNPQIAVLVYFDTPQTTYWGAVVAAPYAKKINEDILPYLGVEQRFTEEELKDMGIEMPFLVGSTIQQAKSKLTSLGLNPTVRGNGETVISQIPDVAAKLQKGATVVLNTENTATQVKVKVPKLVGLPPEKVNSIASANGLNVKLKGENLAGSGVVSASQSIAPGQEVSEGTVIVVEFNSKPQEVARE